MAHDEFATHTLALLNCSTALVQQPERPERLAELIKRELDVRTTLPDTHANREDVLAELDIVITLSQIMLSTVYRPRTAATVERHCMNVFQLIHN